MSMAIEMLLAAARLRVRANIDARAEDAKLRIRSLAQHHRRAMAQRWRYLEAELRG